MDRRARAPGPQMIWLAPRSSLAFQRLSRGPEFGILSVRLAGTRFCCRLPESFVTDRQGVPDDVRGKSAAPQAPLGYLLSICGAAGALCVRSAAPQAPLEEKMTACNECDTAGARYPGA
eukprot:gene13634-biopygen17039